MHTVTAKKWSKLFVWTPQWQSEHCSQRPRSDQLRAMFTWSDHWVKHCLSDHTVINWEQCSHGAITESNTALSDHTVISWEQCSHGAITESNTALSNHAVISWEQCSHGAITESNTALSDHAVISWEQCSHGAITEYKVNLNSSVDSASRLSFAEQ